MKYLSSVAVLLLAAAVFAADEPQKADDSLNRPKRLPIEYASPAYVGAPIAYNAAPAAYPYAAAPAYVAKPAHPAYQYAAPLAAYQYAAAPAAYQYAAAPVAYPYAAAPVAYAAQPAYVKTVHV